MKRDFRRISIQPTVMDVDNVTTQPGVSASFNPGRSLKRGNGGALKGRKLTKRQRVEVTTLISRRQELKYLAFSQAAGAVSSGAAILSVFSQVPQGDTDSERNGDRIMWCGTFEVNLQVVNGQGATADNYNNVRIIFVQWHPNSVPVVGNVLINGPSGAADIYSTYSHDNRQLYHIMYDHVFTTIGNAGSATQSYSDKLTTGIVKLRLPMSQCQKQVQYSAGGLGGTNLIYGIIMSDSALATHPTLAYQTKLFFRDI